MDNTYVRLARFYPRRTWVVPDRLLARSRLDSIRPHPVSLDHDGTPEVDYLVVNNENEDDKKMATYGADLVSAVDAAIGPWLQHQSRELIGPDLPTEVTTTIDAVATETHRLLIELTTADIDQPLSGPLERMRRAVSQLTPALDAAGAQRPRRDPFDAEMRPDDVYALGPMAFSDLGDAVHNAGIGWGAAKAYLHQQRRNTLE